MAQATASAPSMSSVSKAPAGGAAYKNKSGAFKDRQKPEHVRDSNITAAKVVATAIRTSLGPKGMDKMIQSGDGSVTITNDGATILKQMQVVHPAAKMVFSFLQLFQVLQVRVSNRVLLFKLVELSKAQDIEAGDGTTTVVVIAGALLDAAAKLLSKGIHPTVISESFQKAALKSREILKKMSIPVKLTDRQSLLQSASTSLNSKVVSQHSALLAPIAVDAVLKVIDPSVAHNVDLRDIRIINKVGGTIEDTELIDGLVLNQKAAGGDGPKRIEKAKIGLIQFCISPPKTDVCSF
jgi:T-complex protein 1 subunit delta